MLILLYIDTVQDKRWVLLSNLFGFPLRIFRGFNIGKREESFKQKFPKEDFVVPPSQRWFSSGTWTYLTYFLLGRIEFQKFNFKRMVLLTEIPKNFNILFVILRDVDKLEWR